MNSRTHQLEASALLTKWGIINPLENVYAATGDEGNVYASICMRASDVLATLGTRSKNINIFKDMRDVDAKEVREKLQKWEENHRKDSDDLINDAYLSIRWTLLDDKSVVREDPITDLERMIVSKRGNVDRQKLADVCELAYLWGMYIFYAMVTLSIWK